MNLLLAIALGLVGMILIYFTLNAYTQHGDEVRVPDLSGVTLAGIEPIADTMDIEFIIIDSLYSNEIPRGTVADQEPKPGSMVKKGRKIYLTVNAILPQQVGMPNLLNLSFGQAKAVLQTYGLVLGRLEYVPDIAKNAVLDQRVRGASVKKGRMVFKGTVVDLVLGDGLSNTRLPIPYLINLRLSEAEDRLKAWSFNLATFRMDSTVTDTSLARVYRQVPEFNKSQLVPLGSSIILYLTMDTLSIRYDSTLYALKPEVPDSLVMDEGFKEIKNEE